MILIVKAIICVFAVSAPMPIKGAKDINEGLLLLAVFLSCSVLRDLSIASSAINSTVKANKLLMYCKIACTRKESG